MKSLILMLILFLFSTSFVSIQSTNAQTLQATGSYLTDNLGNNIYLKGTQVDWNERRKNDGQFFTIDDVRSIAEAGGNVMEIHGLRLPEIMPERNVINENYFATYLDNWVSWLEQYKVYAIISIQGFANSYNRPRWFWEGLGYVEGTDVVVRDFWDTDIAKQDVNRDALVNLWKYIANRYKNNEYVLFGLVNEPLFHIDKVSNAIAQHLGYSYSQVVTDIIDGIRSMGTQQLIFIDRPDVWYLSYVQPVDRPNIVWEYHLYVGSTLTLDEWKHESNNGIDNAVQRFVSSFGKPLFIGEYGIDPYTLLNSEPWKSTWRNILSEQVAYLDTKPIIGRQWHSWVFLEGEYYDYTGYTSFTAEDSQWIVETVIGPPTPTSPPQPETPETPGNSILDNFTLPTLTFISAFFGVYIIMIKSRSTR